MTWWYSDHLRLWPHISVNSLNVTLNFRWWSFKVWRWFLCKKSTNRKFWPSRRFSHATAQMYFLCWEDAEIPSSCPRFGKFMPRCGLKSFGTRIRFLCSYLNKVIDSVILCDSNIHPKTNLSFLHLDYVDLTFRYILLGVLDLCLQSVYDVTQVLDSRIIL